MQKNEVLGFVLMENVAEPTRPENIQVYDKNGLFYVKFISNLQEFMKPNRNRRIYETSPMMEGLNAPHIQELIRNKTWKGEAGHPLETEMKRILTIDPKLTSHKINSFNLQGNILKGEVETLDDGGFGTKMTKNILQGMEPAFSLRAMAQLTTGRDGIKVVKQKPHIVCYDWVILPSHDKAYRDKSSKIEVINKSLSELGNDIVQESAFAVTEAAIIDFLNADSNNVKLMSNICELGKESMKISKDFKHVILQENQQSFYVKIEDKLRHDVMSYMSRL